MRTFSTGANRHVDTGKHDLDGFLSPHMIEAFGTYMHFNRLLPDGSVRDSDNWQKGIPQDVYRKSLFRHHDETWRALRGYKIKENIIWALQGIIFNAQGLTHELMKDNPELLGKCLEHMTKDREARWAKQRKTRKR